MTNPEKKAPRRAGRGAKNDDDPQKTDNAIVDHTVTYQEKQGDGSTETNASFCIPENFPLDCLGAAKLYHALGFVPFPLNRFDEGTEKEKGKKPKIRGYRRLTHQDISNEFLNRHWGGTKPANIGLTIRGMHVVADLDSKLDGGISARKFVEEHFFLSSFPREITPGGVHIHFQCPDLPQYNAKGKKRRTPIVHRLSSDLTIEFMSEGMPVTVAPSLHRSGTRYRWEVTGELPVISWLHAKQIFGLEERPGQDEVAEKGRPWWLDWEEDLRRLRLTDLLRDLNLLGSCLDSNEGKWAIRCPWESEHSGEPSPEPESDTVIFQKPGNLPAFKCLHSHCSARRIVDFLNVLEKQHPGKIAAYCDNVRNDRSTSETSPRRPRIILPAPGRSASDFAAEIGKVIGPRHELFTRGDEIVEVVPPETDKSAASGLSVLPPKSVVTAVERSADIGRLKSNDEGPPTFITQSMSEAQARVLCGSRQFRQELPRIERMLPTPIPHLDSGSLCYPLPGYNSMTHTWVSTDSPTIGDMSLAEAKVILLNELLAGPDKDGFFWRDSQAQTNALARLLTPYCRALMNWARTPVFLFAGNREGCGKDTCAGIAPTLFTGMAVIGAPLAKGSDDEMRKRITSTIRAGRLFQHFANLKGNIDFPSLEAATDNSGVWEDRLLNSNEIVTLRNEVEFSISANHARWSPDLERRCRQIQLHVPHEDVNQIHYRFPDLLRHVREHRGRYLTALDALVRYWVKQGCPNGPTSFTSFPEWGRVVGGILHACGLGDPCQPHPEAETCGDQETIAMRVLFLWAFDRYGGKSVPRDDFLSAARANQTIREQFDWIEFEEKSGAICFGKLLAKYVRRVLGGIHFNIDRTSKNVARYRFSKAGPDHGLGSVGGEGSHSPMDVKRFCAEPTSSMSPRDATNQRAQCATSHTSLKFPPTGVKRIASEKALQQVADTLSSNNPVSLFMRSEFAKTGEAADTREGNQHNLVVHQDGAGIFDLDLTSLNYNLDPLHQILIDSEVTVVDGKDLLSFLGERCGVNITRVFCLQTAHRLIQAGFDYDDSLYGVLAGLNSGNSDSRNELRVAPGYLDLFALHRQAERLVESTGLRAVWELENELLPVVLQIEKAGVPVDATAMLGIRGKHQDEALRLLEHVEADGRIHAKFNPLGTCTGRFSCKKPNLQGVSRGPIREALRPEPGNMFLIADYSQIELRVAAEIASASSLVEAFRSGVDIHETTAALVLSRTCEGLPTEERRLGKGLNFGLLYGQSASGFRLSARERFGLEISAKEASEYRNAFFHAYPELRIWHNRVRNDAQKGMGETRTLLGRRRFLLKELSFHKRFYTLLNTPVQGTMADGMKRALCLLHQELPRAAKVVSVIHDEVIVEVPSGLAIEELLNLVRKCLVEGMQSVVRNVPIEVEPRFSNSWN